MLTAKRCFLRWNTGVYLHENTKADGKAYVVWGREGEDAIPAIGWEFH